MKFNMRTGAGRRSFLKNAMVAGSAAAVATTGASAVAEVAQEETSTEAKPEAKGYRATEHVNTYYRLARF